MWHTTATSDNTSIIIASIKWFSGRTTSQSRNDWISQITIFISWCAVMTNLLFTATTCDVTRLCITSKKVISNRTKAKWWNVRICQVTIVRSWITCWTCNSWRRSSRCCWCSSCWSWWFTTAASDISRWAITSLPCLSWFTCSKSCDLWPLNITVTRCRCTCWTWCWTWTSWKFKKKILNYWYGIKANNHTLYQLRARFKLK